MNEALAPFALWADEPDPGVRETSHEMARAYGFERTLAEDPKLIADHSVERRPWRASPRSSPRWGSRDLDEPSIGMHFRGLQNVMAHLGMIDPVGPPAGSLGSWRRWPGCAPTYRRTYHRSVTVGEEVREGQVVGELHDLFGDTVRVLNSIASGEIVFCVTSLAVKAGDPLLPALGSPARLTERTGRSWRRAFGARQFSNLALQSLHRPGRRFHLWNSVLTLAG